MSTPPDDTNERDLLAQLLGRYGFSRIASGNSDSPNEGAFDYVQAIGGSLTFGGGCEVVAGDAPNQGDTLPEGDIVRGPFKTVDVDGNSSGVAYAYYDTSQAKKYNDNF